MKRCKYSIIGLLIFLGFSTFGYAAKVEELDMAEQALQSARENQAPKYAPQEYKEAEDTIHRSRERAKEFNGEDDARVLAVLGINKANYAKAVSLEKQQEEKLNLLKAQIAEARKDFDNAKILSDKIKQELEFYKANPPKLME